MAERTRDRMIETTSRLLQERGYFGTSLGNILAESGAPRGSLYFHFPGGKTQLVVEATRIAIAEATAALRQTLAEASTPGQGVRRFIETTAQMMADSGYRFGCPVAPIILDDHGDEDELAALCRSAFEDWSELMRAAFEEAGIEAERAAILALMVEATHEGLLLIARARRDVGPLLSVAAELETHIDAALRPRPSP